MSASSNNRSVSQAFGALFGTVTTIASSASTAVNAAGNLFEELEQRSSSRLRTVGTEILLAEHEKSQRLVTDSAMRTSEFLLETTRKLKANPDLEKTYIAVMADITAKINNRSQVNSESNSTP